MIHNLCTSTVFRGCSNTCKLHSIKCKFWMKLFSCIRPNLNLEYHRAMILYWKQFPTISDIHIQFTSWCHQLSLYEMFLLSMLSVLNCITKHTYTIRINYWNFITCIKHRKLDIYTYIIIYVSLYQVSGRRDIYSTAHHEQKTLKQRRFKIIESLHTWSQLLEYTLPY